MWLTAQTGQSVQGRSQGNKYQHWRQSSQGQGSKDCGSSSSQCVTITFDGSVDFHFIKKQKQKKQQSIKYELLKEDWERLLQVSYYMLLSEKKTLKLAHIKSTSQLFNLQL